jgi:hypothetical protein
MKNKDYLFILLDIISAWAPHDERGRDPGFRHHRQRRSGVSDFVR